MSRALAVALVISLGLGMPLFESAHAADHAPVRDARKAELTLVVAKARGSETRLQSHELVRSLEQRLGVRVIERQASSDTKLGVLSVMLSGDRTTLLWTLPDGRSGLARLRSNAEASELSTQVVNAAHKLYQRFGVGPSALAMNAR